MPSSNIVSVNLLIDHLCFGLKRATLLWRFNSIALRKAKIVYNFGLSECNRVNKGPKQLTSEFIDKLHIDQYEAKVNMLDTEVN